MHNVKWLVETTAIVDDTEPMVSAFSALGIEYKEIHRNDLYDSNFCFDNLFDPKDCVVFFGSLNLAKRLRREAKWIPGAYYNVKEYDCEYYYPHFGDMLLNRDYMMFPFGELKRQKEFIYHSLGEDRTIFLRPTRGDKTFTGKTVYKEDFEKELGIIGFGQVEPHELIVAARPLNLVKEWRFVCVQGQVIDGSSYKENNRAGSAPGYTDEAFEMASKVAGMYNPDPAWVIDIGLTKGGRYAVVEVGCFSCAGLYKCNRELVIQNVSRAALEEWEEYQ